MTSVAIAACRLTDESPPEELYPDPDAALLSPALVAAGATSVELVSWDDERADWSSFDVVLVSSTWDSVDRPVEYLAWIATVPHLQNRPEVLAWNLDKSYLRDLEAAGLPIVPTTWVAPDDAPPVLPSGDVVVKPSVSAGGRSTAWYSASAHAEAQAHVLLLQRARATVMVQEHVAGVAAVGEVKAVYLDGEYSHASRVGGLLDRDAGTIERPWEKPVPASATDASAEERAVGDAVLAELSRHFGGAPTYGRVDLVVGGDGRVQILEVELIDPLLSLDRHPSAAGRLARAVLRRAAPAR